jgi:poly(3-hydroxybutyrate) depolymerase
MAANGNHRPLGLAIRLVGVAVVIVAAIAVKELVLDTTPAPSHTAGSKVVDYTVDSKLLGEEVPVSVVVPPGARDGLRSLLVFLHGRGDDEQSYLTDPMFRGLARQGGPAPVVAFPRGGPDSYWHDRDDGAWGSFVLEELIPALVKRFEIEPEQIGIGGISMGGFGALDIAARSPGTFCAVGAHSPAVWLDASDTAQGAFDDEEDFAAHDVASGLAAGGQARLARRRRRGPLPRGDPEAGRDALLLGRPGQLLGGPRRPRERLLGRQLAPLHALLRDRAQGVPGEARRRQRTAGERGGRRDAGGRLSVRSRS